MTLDSFKAAMKKDVKKLEAKMVTGFSNQDLVRKKIHDGLEAKKEAVSEMSECEGCEAQRQLYRRCCRYGYGLGSETCARLPPLGPNRKENWLPRELEIHGWVKESSMKEMTGRDEQVMTLLRAMEKTSSQEVNDFIAWTFSEAHQGRWSKETMISL